MIKRKTDYKTTEWPNFCRLARELVDEQEGEIEKAIIGVGEYKFSDGYEHLEIPVSKWSSMSQLQRRKHLQRIRTISMNEAVKVCDTQKRKPSNKSPLPSSNTSPKEFSLCGKLFDASACHLSSDILTNMFAKAEKLVRAPEGTSICLSPGSSTSRLVVSKSGQRPHFVQKKTAGKFCCDSDCPMWRCSKLCSHTIACAFQDGNLQEFISHTTGQLSFYALAKSGTSDKAGKKPGKKRKASTKSTTRALAGLQEEIATPVQYSSVGSSAQPPYPQVVSSASTVMATPAGKPSQTSTLSSTTQPLATSHQTGQSGSEVNPACVRISQAPFANSSIIFPSSITQSPVVSISEPAGSVSVVNTAVSSAVTPSQGRSRAVIARILSTPTTSGSQALSTGTAQGTPTNMALSSLLSEVLGARSSTNHVIDPNYLFWVMLVCGNISRCQGCSQKILRSANGKPLPPPDDLVIQHKEQVLFQNPKTGNFQLSHEMRNVYYHANLSCVIKKYRGFEACAHLRISRDTLLKLSELHKSYLLKEFGIQFAV